MATARRRGNDDAPPSRADLLGERERLTARLAEIDRLLTSGPRAPERQTETAVQIAPERRRR